MLCTLHPYWKNLCVPNWAVLAMVVNMWFSSSLLLLYSKRRVGEENQLDGPRAICILGDYNIMTVAAADRDGNQVKWPSRHPSCWLLPVPSIYKCVWVALCNGQTVSSFKRDKRNKKMETSRDARIILMLLLSFVKYGKMVYGRWCKKYNLWWNRLVPLQV